ncbi:hypothetical protein AVEN_15313-1, partial [Araneus ventricosus]
MSALFNRFPILLFALKNFSDIFTRNSLKRPESNVNVARNRDGGWDREKRE